MQQLLQGFYQGQGDQPVWSVNGRLGALETALAQLADDGLDPGNYKVPPGSGYVEFSSPHGPTLRWICQFYVSLRNYCPLASIRM